jgi:pyruvate formate lyase activating enzyme
MILGGLQKSSMIDYPGKVSCVCFLTGCNFDCPYCHNPHLVLRDWVRLNPIEESRFYTFLEARKDFLDGVVVTGGEPTLDKDLISLCRRIKAMGYPVKLDTNGSRPDVIRSLIGEGLLDYIAMDIKTELSRYPLYIKRGFDPAALLLSIRMIMEWDRDYEFRTTCVRPLVDREVVEHIAKIIDGAKLYALQSFRAKELLHPEFFEGLEAGYGKEEMISLRSAAEPWVKRCILR